MLLDELIITIEVAEVDVIVEDPPETTIKIESTPDIVLIATGYLGPQGPTGPRGPAGGPRGHRGSLWYSDNGEPDITTPITGEMDQDHYLDLLTGDVWRFEGELVLEGAYGEASYGSGPYGGGA